MTGYPAADDDAAIVKNEVKVLKRLDERYREVSFTVGRRHRTSWQLDDYLRVFCPRYPKELIARWCAEGRLTVDEVAATAAQIVAGGQRVRLLAPLPKPDPTYIVPPLEILHHDDDCIAANKPVAQLAHPAGKIMTGTLLNLLADWVAARGGAPDQVRLVNRIDRDTSGICLASRTLEAHIALATALAERRAVKEYLAICHGVPAALTGEWTEPLGEDPRGSVARVVRDDGQPCRTEYRVVAVAPTVETGKAPRFALLRLVLHTGRQHQIRVHCAHHGHPLVGDWVYGQPCAELPGQALHSALLTIPHPRGGELAITAPMTSALEKIWQNLLDGGAPTPVPLNAEQRSRMKLPPA